MFSRTIFVVNLCKYCKIHPTRTLHGNVTARAEAQNIENNTSVLEDSFGRRHTYLRISLTERCNLRCTYCMPEDGITLTPRSHLLNTNEILRLAELFVKQGVTKIRLTGGEPTVHTDLKRIIEHLRTLSGLKTIGITTNGLALTRQLDDLQKAGLDSLNISLDTLQEKKFETITRRKGWSRVMDGIDRALELGYDPVKINCVVTKNVNDDEILDFVELTKNKNIYVRFIEYMPFGGNKWHADKLVSYAQLIDAIRLKYTQFYPLNCDVNDTSKPYKVAGFVGRVGFISSITNNFCGGCNRLRLLADGSLKVCLLGSAEISLRDALRNGCSEDDILALINAAVMRKKKQHADRFTTNARDGDSIRILITRKLGTAYAIPARKCTTFTHITENGEATMVDVDDKALTRRRATAVASVHVGARIIRMIRDNNLKKGDVFSVAKLAGIMAAKKTSELVPLCHNIVLSHVDVTLQIDERTESVRILSQIRCTSRTGVEMEAMTAVAVAALTVYDMCKAVSHECVIENVRLLSKTGGKRDYRCASETDVRAYIADKPENEDEQPR